MATSLRFDQHKPSSTEPATAGCWDLGRKTFDWTDSSSDVQDWHRRIDSADAMFFTASDDNKIQGFLLAMPRIHSEIGSQTLHIALAAVEPSHRGLNIFPRLLEMVEAYREVLGIGTLTICTSKVRFPKMYRMLSGGGKWEEVCVRKTDLGQQHLFVKAAVGGSEGRAVDASEQ